MKIKIIKVNRTDYTWDDEVNRVLIQGILDWQEVDQKDYILIHDWVIRKNTETLRKSYSTNEGIMVLAIQPDEEEIDVVSTVAELKQMIVNEKKKEEAAKVKSQKAKVKASAARKLKQYEKLKKELDK